MTIEQLFFELIRVAIGTQDTLSRPPSAEEWKLLYDMAKKQSLVGVCFSAVQRLSGVDDSMDSTGSPQVPHKPYTINLPEVLYLTWMGMAAKIQQRNEVVNRQCVELQARLSADGFRSCILKGQGNHIYYGDIAGLRQSGDIDVWLDCSSHDILRYVQKVAPTDDVNEMHAHLHIFEDTDVEVHFVPNILSNRMANRKLQRWFVANKDAQFDHRAILPDGKRLVVPTTEFNLVYQLVHIYRHLLGEGIGLRQLMDYYYLLCAVKDTESIKKSRKVIHELGLDTFASALMWVIHYVFGIEQSRLIWAPSPKVGHFLLSEIVQMGNFGHEDLRFKLSKEDSHLKRYVQMVFSKLRFIAFFPVETIWQPIDIFLRFFEIRAVKKRAKRFN